MNAIVPGVVETDMSSFTKTDASRKSALNIQALQRLAQPEDIALAVAFLASDDARRITGDTIRATGDPSSDSLAFNGSNPAMLVGKGEEIERRGSTLGRISVF